VPAARRVLKVFLTKDVSARGWFCVRGHASQNQPWAAACASRAGAIVRAYGPVRRERASARRVSRPGSTTSFRWAATQSTSPSRPRIQTPPW